MSNRSEYIEKCKKENQALFSSKSYILSYARDKHGRPTGVLLVYKTNGDILKVGWSKCNTKAEPFNKHVGVQKAISRAIDFSTFEHLAQDGALPHSIGRLAERVLPRATRYFKLEQQVA